eukprot:gb/GEZN01016489.1/.p1 GENE.gb/GEZN01016489.1/~~gb/GEZN01016489.1/.p1  ORF type:complete len:204 (-),score=23.04 gb/GEZN01016489.1/:96-707(-)
MLKRSFAILRAPKVGVLVGSIRTGSVNAKVATLAASLLAKKGAEVHWINLKDYDLPLYAQDVEAAGFPKAATALKEKMSGCDGWLLGCPEYNGCMTPLFVNALTWASRPSPVLFNDKTALITSASPGPLGGMRAHSMYRQLLVNLGVNVAPASVAVGSAFEAFGAEGELVNERQTQMLDSACNQFFQITRGVIYVTSETQENK